MKELNYLDFTNRIVKTRQRRPLYGQIELTSRCGYSCIHCYCNTKPREELSLELWKDILSQILDLGGIEITFTGGEPLRYPGFAELYTFAKEKGFLVTLFSSGYDFNRKMLEFFKVNPPLCIEITLNSLKEDVYERIVKVKGAFKTAMNNIYAVKKAGLPLVLKCNAFKENKDEILDIKKFAEQLLGPGKFRFDPLVYSCAAKCGSANGGYRLSPDEIIDIESKDADMRAQWMNRLSHQSSLFNPRGLYHCNSWLTFFYINPQGILQFCHLSQKYSADLRYKPFREGFDKFILLLEQRYKSGSRCSDCEYRHYCYNCPARAFLETGDEESEVEYYCRFAKAAKDYMDRIKDQNETAQPT
ncbi:MAG TPA: hypothetical protein DEQ77_10790 [Candidatus Omnitrophica bacterium]|nr:hypothetical protein [Candidatus Omnitrophota bacterium]